MKFRHIAYELIAFIITVRNEWEKVPINFMFSLWVMKKSYAFRPTLVTVFINNVLKK